MFSLLSGGFPKVAEALIRLIGWLFRGFSCLLCRRPSSSKATRRSLPCWLAGT